MQELQDPPSTPDWEYIQAKYLQGVTPKELALETGVKADRISVHASRKGWTNNLRRTTGSLKVTVGTTQDDSGDSTESNALGKASAKARASLSDEVLRAVATLTDTKPSKSLGTQSKRVQVLQTLAGAAKTVFGWSEGQSQPSVRINVLSSFTVEPASPSVQDQAPVIDVASVPVSLPPSEPV